MKGYVYFRFDFRHFILLLTVAPILSRAYETGSPLPACESMGPNHEGHKSKDSSTNPYKLVLSKTTVEQNSTVEITLTSKSGNESFAGFLVQVRKPGVEKMAFGDFDEYIGSKNARRFTCFSVKDKSNAMTHKAKDPKTSVTIQWIANTDVGDYRIHVTYLKDYSTFWSNQMHDQVIKVIPAKSQAQPQVPLKKVSVTELQAARESQSQLNKNTEEKSPKNDMKLLCSTMKLSPDKETKEASNNSTSPYLVKLENNHKVEQKAKIWINTSSEWGTPIMKMIIQVRKPSTKDGAYGKFIKAVHPDPEEVTIPEKDYEIASCFGGNANTIIYTNSEHHKSHISDVNVLWEAPAGETGDFEVIVSVLNDEDFWYDIEKDKDTKTISVVKPRSESGVIKAEPKPTESANVKEKESSPTSSSSSLLAHSKHFVPPLFSLLIMLAFK